MDVRKTTDFFFNVETNYLQFCNMIKSVLGFSVNIGNDIQNTLILLWEVSLILGAIWLILKKNNNNHHLNLSKTEEERIIAAYEPESLVEDVSATHYALNPLIVKGKIGTLININGFDCIDFATHDYLGLIGNKQIEDQARECIDIYGVGSCGPRGFYGTTLQHLELEQLLADIFKAETSIVYSYGFVTLASAIPAYAKKTDVIFVDEKRNFAIKKGLEASGSEVKYFKHNDAKDLERILEHQNKLDKLNTRKARRIRRYLVIEGIYINTGKICPLPELLELCKKFKVRVFVDESVSFGTLGSTGKGVTEYFEVPRADIDLIMGSFEYSLASVGGFCVGSHLLVDHQLASGQGYCFSASLPPLLATAAIGALCTIQNNPDKLQQLNKQCKIMHCKLNDSIIINRWFLVSGDRDSPIHVLSLKSQTLLSQGTSAVIIDAIIAYSISQKIALTRAATLKEDNTMAKGAIRVTTHLFHTEQQISCLINVLEDACTNIQSLYSLQKTSI